MTRPRGPLRLAAALLGLAVAGSIIGVAEHWQRAHELGEMRVCFDPPGLKYVLADSGERPDRGWQEGTAAAPPLPGVTRVICVGDSVTYGVSVAENEAWCARLGRGLGRAEAFNFGMNGWDAEQVATLVESRLDAWQPDVLVWGAYVNDVFPTYLLYGLRTQDPVFVGTDIPARARVLPESWSLFLVRNSALFRRLQGAWYARSERSSGPAPPRPGWYDAQVDRVAKWAAGNGTPLVVIAIPPHAMTDPDTCPAQFPVPGLCDVSAAQYAQVTASLTRAGIPYVDGLAAYRAGGQPHYHPNGRLDPDHPNAAGHALLARAALPAVRAALGSGEEQGNPEGSPFNSEATPTAAPMGKEGPRHDRPAPRHPGGGRRRAAGGAPAE